MTLLRRFLVGPMQWAGGFIAWITGGIGALVALVGVSDLYFGEYETSTLYFLGIGLAVVIGSAIAHNKLTGI